MMPGSTRSAGGSRRMTTLPPASSRVALWLVVAAVAVWLAQNRDHLDRALIESAIYDLGLLAPLGHVVLFALGTILFVPGAIFGLLGGVLFGPLWGAVLNLTGATLGATARGWSCAARGRRRACAPRPARPCRTARSYAR